jgi:cytochrome c
LRQIKAAIPDFGLVIAVTIRDDPMRYAIPLVVLMISVAPVARAADVAAGRAIFDTTCGNCHSLRVGVNEVGPSLWHVIGRPAASVPGYMYSNAMKRMDTNWTKEALNAYLAEPRADVHGAEMFFKGLPNARDRANIIAYLQSQQ